MANNNNNRKHRHQIFEGLKFYTFEPKLEFDIENSSLVWNKMISMFWGQKNEMMIYCHVSGEESIKPGVGTKLQHPIKFYILILFKIY